MVKRMEKLVIRKAKLEDAEIIALLARITFTETFGHYFRDNQDLLDYYDKTFSVSKIRNSLAKENNVFWIALIDELPVGYAKLKKYSSSDFIDSDKVSQLQKIYILKDFISKKIGHKMQSEMFEEVIKIGNKYIWLSVLESNERAISFYTINGFTEIGKHSFDIGQEHFRFIAMMKKF
jgi:ribosomal protein S18 acetylase RimI-like enzyme